MTRHRELLESELIAARLPIFTDAEKVIADPVVRNRGTIGGCPLPGRPGRGPLRRLRRAQGAGGDPRPRTGSASIGMDEFHRGPYETAVADGEMLDRDPRSAARGLRQRLREGRAPRGRLGGGGGRGRGAAGRRHDRRRRHRAHRGRRATCTSKRAEDALGGQAPSDERSRRPPRQIAAEDCSPTADQRGTVEYKRHLAQELTHRALRRAVARALGGEA